eukprot:3202674-Heterocapsa_arctica.AAC.1
MKPQLRGTGCMPVSYPQHTSGFIPCFVPRFHTPQYTSGSYPQHTSGFIPGFIPPVYPVSYPGSILRNIPAVSCWFHTPVSYPVVSYRFHGVHPRAAVSYP